MEGAGLAHRKASRFGGNRLIQAEGLDSKSDALTKWLPSPLGGLPHWAGTLIDLLAASRCQERGPRTI
jgi:hypothetical protein